MNDREFDEMALTLACGTFREEQLRVLTRDIGPSDISIAKDELRTFARRIRDELQKDMQKQTVWTVDLYQAAQAVHQTCLDKWGSENGVTRDALNLVNYFALQKERAK